MFFPTEEAIFQQKSSTKLPKRWKCFGHGERRKAEPGSVSGRSWRGKGGGEENDQVM